MSDQYLGQIQIFPLNFAPRGWAFCNGQLLPISQNTALFALLGTYYGGNGSSTFALPNLQGRIPVHQGQGPGLTAYSIGTSTGSPTVSLVTSQIPSHVHALPASSANGHLATPTATSGLGSTTSRGGTVNVYASSTDSTALSAAACQVAGSSGAHNNMMPFVALNYCIALQGIFPSRN